jgi:hypothetical protein
VGAFVDHHAHLLKDSSGVPSFLPRDWGHLLNGQVVPDGGTQGEVALAQQVLVTRPGHDRRRLSAVFRDFARVPVTSESDEQLLPLFMPCYAASRHPAPAARAGYGRFIRAAERSRWPVVSQTAGSMARCIG